MTEQQILTSDHVATYHSRRAHKVVRIGVFNVGFHRYWPQFPGLREELDSYRLEFEAKLRALGVEVVSAGLVDDVDSGRSAGDFFASRDVDLIFCFVTTYVQSAFVLPVAQLSKKHVVLVGLQPTPGMDLRTANTHNQLAHDNCTSLPEIMYAFRRANIPSDVVFGMLHDDPRAWGAIAEWTLAARAARVLRNGRIGLMGHPFEGMLDMNADPTSFSSAFGMHVDMIEMCDLKKRVDGASPAEIRDMRERIEEFFAFPEPGSDSIAGLVAPESLDRSAAVAVGLEKLVADFRLDGLAHYYRGVDGNEYTQLIANIIVGASMLTARGIPVAGEGDLKNLVAMLIMDRLDAGGSFSELHPADFREDFVFVGHDGPGHVAISDEKPALRGLSLYHGKFGAGVSVEFKVKQGPVTILGLTTRQDGRFKLVLAEGESVAGAIPATGNTNTRCRFRPDMPTFIERWTEAGPTHHFALGIGKQISTLRKVGRAHWSRCGSCDRMTPAAKLPWFTCLLLFAATALSFLDRQVLSVLAPGITAEFGMNNTAYSHVVFAFQLSYTIMFSVSGRIIDRLGTRLGMALTLGVWSLASAAHSLVTGPFGLGAARFALGIGEGGCFPGATKGATEWFPPDKRAFAIGIATGGSALGAVIAPPLTAILARQFGWRGAFLSTGGLGAIWLVVWLARAPGRVLNQSLVPGEKPDWRNLWKGKRLPLILAARFLFDPVFYFYMFWIPQYLSSERKLSIDAIGSYFWVPFLTLGISQVFSGRLSDRLIARGRTPVESRLTLMTVAACMTPASWFASQAPTIFWALALMSMLTFAHGIWITNFLGLLGDLFPAAAIGTVTGLTGTAGGIGAMLSTLMVGRTVDRFSYSPVFAVSGILYPLALAVIFLSVRRRDSREINH